MISKMLYGYVKDKSFLVSAKRQMKNGFEIIKSDNNKYLLINPTTQFLISEYQANLIKKEINYLHLNKKEV